MENIYFKGAELCKNLEELLVVGFGNYKFVTTYSDPEYMNQQCYPARRSFGDLLIIVKTYFPQITEKDLAKELHKLYKKQKMRGLFCPNISRIVFVGEKSDNRFIDESLVTGESYADIDKYTVNKIFGLILN